MTTLETLTELVDAYGIDCYSSADDLDTESETSRTALLTALAAVVRDAERYRWLRIQPKNIDAPPEQLDSAIDAALQASGVR